MTDRRNILIFSVLSGLLFWCIDAVFDSLVFSHQSLLDSLILDLSAHEFYFRLLFLIGIIIFGQFIANALEHRNKAQSALERTRAHMEDEKVRSESILSAIGDGISIQDREFRILYQNQAHMDLVGGDKKGQLCYQAYSKRDSVCPECPLTQTMKDGRIRTIEKKLMPSTEDRRIEIKASPVRDAAGTITGGIEAVRDITERKSVMEKVRLFSKALEEAMDGIQIIDLSGHVLYSNRAVRDIYGFSPEELAGRHVNDMNEDKEYASRVIIPDIQKFGRWSGEINVLHKDGHAFPIWLSTSLVTDDAGAAIAMIGIIRDITERKHSEEMLKRHREELVKLVADRTGELTETNEKLQKEIADREKMEEELLKTQKLESIAVLAGGIAHDFNNLLASVLGNVSLAMLDLDKNHPASRELAAAEKAALRAQDLTRQLLTFSRGGAPIKRVTHINELIREASGFAVRGSRIRCDIHIPADLHLVDVDGGQISQVIHNLVLNADHAMPEGGTITIRCGNVRVHAQAAIPLPAGNYVMITVEDRGVGIPREHLAKIFDPYFTTKQKGSGLGLAMTYSIIKKHGGHIAVESTLGKGTTFHVYLPAAREKMAPQVADEAGIHYGSGKILVMDDEEDVRETTGNVLNRLGYTVDFAKNGEEAIDLYRKALDSKQPFDLIIMDLTVPGAMGGKEAVRRILEIDPGAKAIVSSGYSNDPIMADFRSYGFLGVVTKPYRIKDLSEEVYQILNKPA